MIVGKKAVAAAVLWVIIVVLAIWIISSYSGRECSKDSDCGSEKYCGSDFKCHEFKVIEKTEVHFDFLLPAVFIGIAIIIAAYVLRSRSR